VSTEVKETNGQGQSNGQPEKPILFSRNAIPRVAGVKVKLPLIKGLEFLFEFKIRLSKDMQAERETWLGQRVSEREKNYEEVTLKLAADLLVRDPQGFDPADWPTEGSPGEKLLAYFQATTDPDAKKLIFDTIEAAISGYWAIVLPSAFPA